MKKIIVSNLLAVLAVGCLDAAPKADTIVARDLFKEVRHIDVKRGGYSQTQAHISVDSVQAIINENPVGFSEHKELINQVLVRENENKRQNDVFYTVQDCSRLLQDVARELYKRNVGSVGALKNDAFQFVRYEYGKPVYNQFSDINLLLTHTIKKDGIVIDQFGNNMVLVPADLSLFGSAGKGYSAWMRFNKPTQQCDQNAIRESLRSVLASYGYSDAYVNKLLELQTYLVDKAGTPLADLLQIFVPESIVDANGYLSWRYDQSLMDAVLTSANVRATASQGGFNKAVGNFNRLYKSGDATARAVINGLVQKIESGDFKLEQYLYKYRTEPQALSDLNFAQARLLVTNKVLLNPESGVKIYRYSKMDAAKEAAYKIDLERILLQMDVEKEARDAIRVK